MLPQIWCNGRAGNLHSLYEKGRHFPFLYSQSQCRVQEFLYQLPRIRTSLYTYILYEIRISLACSPSDQNTIGLKHQTNSFTPICLQAVLATTQIFYFLMTRKSASCLTMFLLLLFSSSMNRHPSDYKEVCQHDTLRLFFLSWCLSPSTFLGFPLCKQNLSP